MSKPTHIENVLREMNLSVGDARKWLADAEQQLAKRASVRQGAERLAQLLLPFITRENPKSEAPAFEGNDLECCECGDPNCIRQPSFTVEDVDPSDLPSYSNVTIIPGKTTEDTAVWVGDVEVKGLIRARLEFDPELEFPVLTLEIINPKIDNSVVG